MLCVLVSTLHFLKIYNFAYDEEFILNISHQLFMIYLNVFITEAERQK